MTTKDDAFYATSGTVDIMHAFYATSGTVDIMHHRTSTYEWVSYSNYDIKDTKNDTHKCCHSIRTI